MKKTQTVAVVSPGFQCAGIGLPDKIGGRCGSRARGTIHKHFVKGAFIAARAGLEIDVESGARFG